MSLFNREPGLLGDAIGGPAICRSAAAPIMREMP
jgi:hypothetical protein